VLTPRKKKMPNQGHKVRGFRLNDEDYQKLLHIAKANDCNTLKQFIECIVKQDLIVIKNFSQNT
jgi:hypothetical protein